MNKLEAFRQGFKKEAAKMTEDGIERNINPEFLDTLNSIDPSAAKIFKQKNQTIPKDPEIAEVEIDGSQAKVPQKFVDLTNKHYSDKPFKGSLKQYKSSLEEAMDKSEVETPFMM